MKILWGARAEFILKRLAGLESKLRRQTELNLSLAAEIEEARKANRELGQENEKLRADNKQFTSPRYRAKIRAEIEHERRADAMEALKKELPPELAEKVDWDAVDWM